MPADAMPSETKFDLMADLCILAGQAVMQVGSNDLQAAMRAVLGILGQEVAARFVAKTDLASEGSPARSTAPKTTKLKTGKRKTGKRKTAEHEASKPQRRAEPDRLSSCA